MNFLQSFLRVGVSREGAVSRRSFLRTVTASGAGLAALSWLDVMTLEAETLRRRGMACILLWMAGGPSQFETFDPKPGTATGGATAAIATAVPGIQVAEHWPNLARLGREMTIIRSMTSKEGEHQRATYMLHTGYQPVGGVKHPGLGSIVASELGAPQFDLPHLVSISGTTIGAGLLGVQHEPFVVANPLRPPANLTVPGTKANPRAARRRYLRRFDLMRRLEADFAAHGGKQAVADHDALYKKTAALVLSPRLKAFDLGAEPDAVRDRYGRNPFGQGVLLARRLVEAGVTFVEVKLNGWDTHQENFKRVPGLARQADPAMAALVGDLKARGLLAKTLVIWMGEFGRTPKINPKAGRDHYPKAFNVVLAGGGIQGGQVIGSTNRTGTEVADQPVTVADLFCTFCRSLHIDPRKENISPNGRPIKIVDGGAPVMQLFG